MQMQCACKQASSFHRNLQLAMAGEEKDEADGLFGIVASAWSFIRESDADDADTKDSCKLEQASGCAPVIRWRFAFDTRTLQASAQLRYGKRQDLPKLGVMDQRYDSWRPGTDTQKKAIARGSRLCCGSCRCFRTCSSETWHNEACSLQSSCQRHQPRIVVVCWMSSKFSEFGT